MKAKNIGYYLIIFAIVYIIYKQIIMNGLGSNNIEKVFKKISKEYGNEIAKNVERIYRLETNNFNSQQFKETYSAGMEAFSTAFPYGWSIGGYWNEKGKKYSPIGVITLREGKGLLNDGGNLKRFVKFPNLESAMFSLAEFLKIYGNNAGRWFSTNEGRQQAYNDAIQKVNTLFT